MYYTIKRNFEFTGNIVTANVIGIAAALFILVSPTMLRAEMVERDPERCEAYRMLADCDAADCEETCARSDASLRGECDGRCNERYHRDLRRRNQRYRCGFDICDPDLLTRRLDLRRARMTYCVARCEFLDKPESCSVTCTERYDTQVENLCEQAQEDGCPGAVVAASCGQEP